MANAESLSHAALLKGVAQALDDTRDAIETHVEGRLDSLVGLTKVVEEQTQTELYRVSEKLVGAIGIYLNQPISFSNLPGPTPHPLFSPSEKTFELLLPVRRSTLSPDWIKDFVGPA